MPLCAGMLVCTLSANCVAEALKPSMTEAILCFVVLGQSMLYRRIPNAQCFCFCVVPFSTTVVFQNNVYLRSCLPMRFNPGTRRRSSRTWSQSEKQTLACLTRHSPHKLPHQKIIPLVVRSRNARNQGPANLGDTLRYAPLAAPSFYKHEVE